MKKFIEDMYLEYYDRLMVIACSYTHDKNLAEDIVQNTFLKAMLSYKKRGSFLAWCCTVMRNEFYDSCRHNKHFADVSIAELDISEGTDLVREYIEGEERAQLAAMIAALPLRQREVMLRYVYAQDSDEEIAAALETSRDNVRQIRSRAVKALKKMAEQGLSIRRDKKESELEEKEAGASGGSENDQHR